MSCSATGRSPPAARIATSNPGPGRRAVSDLIGSALFEQERERTGGLIDVQCKPTRRPRARPQVLHVGPGRDELQPQLHVLGHAHPQAAGPAHGQAPRSGLRGPQQHAGRGELLGAGRRTSTASTTRSRGRTRRRRSNFVSLDASYAVSDALHASGEVGTSEGHGETPTQDVSETGLPAGTGGGYQLNGVGSAPDFNFGAADTSTPFPGGMPVGFGWIFGAQDVDVEDQEDWAQIDADFTLDGGALDRPEFGVRYATTSATRSRVIGQGPTLRAGRPVRPGQLSGRRSRTIRATSAASAATFPTDIWFWTPGAARGLQQLRHRQPRSGGARVLTGRCSRSRRRTRPRTCRRISTATAGAATSACASCRPRKTSSTYVAGGSPTDPDAILGSAFGPFKPCPSTTRTTTGCRART